MSPSRILAGVVVATAAALVPAPSQAASSFVCTSYSSCRDMGLRGWTYEQDQSHMYWNMFPGINCTNYVAWRLIKSNGLPNKRPKPGVGNARDWGKQLPELTTQTPAVGSVAWWGYDGKSHVAYVEKVESASSIVISESNYGRAFDHRRITRGTGWPDGFIHFTTGTLAVTEKPTISGKPVMGSTLKVDVGASKPAATSASVQWLRDGKAISGATARTYTPPASAVGHRIRVRVTLKRSSYVARTTDAPDLRLKAGAFAAPQPALDGVAKVDERLTAVAGTWKPAREDTAYQWFVDGRAVAGATRSTFTPGPESAGTAITVAVTGTTPGYTTRTVTSGSSAAVALGDLRATVRPTVVGTPQVDQPLRASAPSWDKSGVSTRWEWLRDEQPISGATTQDYTPGPADVGHVLKARATGSRTGYETATIRSRAGDEVAPGEFSTIGRPQLTGDPRVGSSLHAEPGSWSPTATFRYQWLVDGKAIHGATAQDYTPGPARLGRRLSVSVTASRPGYTSVTRTTRSTDAVQPGRIAVGARPVVSGSLTLGGLLTAQTQVPTPADATLTYQWLRDGRAVDGATGQRYRVRSADLGHSFRVRVSYTARGYTSRSTTSVATARATAPSRLSTRTASTQRGVLTVKVRLESDGPIPTGGVTLTARGKTATATLVDGVATLTLRGLASGVTPVTVAYAGDARTSGATRSYDFTIR